MIDFDALTRPQINMLANVAFGGTGQGLYHRTGRALVQRELLVEHTRLDGGFRWVEYTMPLPVHIEFCAWCADRVERAA
jgi:hypothetical protein